MPTFAEFVKSLDLGDRILVLEGQYGGAVKEIRGTVACKMPTNTMPCFDILLDGTDERFRVYEYHKPRAIDVPKKWDDFYSARSFAALNLRGHPSWYVEAYGEEKWVIRLSPAGPLLLAL